MFPICCAAGRGFTDLCTSCDVTSSFTRESITRESIIGECVPGASLDKACLGPSLQKAL